LEVFTATILPTDDCPFRSSNLSLPNSLNHLLSPETHGPPAAPYRCFPTRCSIHLLLFQSRSPCVHVDPCSARYHLACPLPAANTTTQPRLSEEVLAQRAAAAVAAEAGAEVEEERKKRRGGRRKSNDDKEQQNGRDGTKKVKQRPRLWAGVNSNSHVLSLPVPHSQHRVQHPHPTHPPPLLHLPRRNLHQRHPHPVIDENTPHTLYQERHRGQRRR
jgi:hypothetical protein